MRTSFHSVNVPFICIHFEKFSSYLLKLHIVVMLPISVSCRISVFNFTNGWLNCVKKNSQLRSKTADKDLGGSARSHSSVVLGGSGRGRSNGARLFPRPRGLPTYWNDRVTSGWATAPLNSSVSRSSERSNTHLNPCHSVTNEANADSIKTN
jgi:hypothetical protein